MVIADKRRDTFFDLVKADGLAQGHLQKCVGTAGKWLCASMNAGISVWPFKSTISQSRPAAARTSASLPTARITPSSTKSACAYKMSSIVSTVPP